MALDTDTMNRILNELTLTGEAPSATTPEEKRFVEDILEDMNIAGAMAERASIDPPTIQPVEEWPEFEEEE